MAVPRIDCLLFLAMALVLVAGAGAQSTSNCTTEYDSLSPCISYVAGTDQTPSVLCCTAVKLLNTDYPSCLCEVVAQLNTTANVNTTKAYALPGACGISIDTANCPSALAPALPPGASIAPTPAPLSSTPSSGPAMAPSSPGSAAPLTRPSAVLGALAALGVSVFFSGLWIGAFRDF